MVIALAVLAVAAQLLLPLLARHPQWVAAQLSQQLQRPVAFAQMQGRWQTSGPLFVLRDVRIGSPASGGVLRLPQSELKLDFGGWLLPSRHVFNLYVRGLQLNLRHDTAGRWHVDGIGTGDGQQQSASLGSLSMALWLRDLRLEIADEASGRHYRLLADQLRLSREGHTIRLGVALRREGAAGQWRGAGTFREDGSAGKLWLAGADIDLRALFGDIGMGGYTARSGRGSMALWLDWKQAQVVRSLARVDLAELAISNPAGVIATVPALHGMLALDQRADGYLLRWAGDDTSALALTQHRSGTATARIGVALRGLPLASWLPWLALKPGLSPALAQWLTGGRAHGVMNAASAQWSASDGLSQLEATFENVGIDAVGTLPGVSGVHGTLRGDAEALALTLPTQSTVINLPTLFRKPLALAQLAGQFAFWREGAAWKLGIDPLEFSGDAAAGADYAGQVRGELALPDDHSGTFADLVATVDHADVRATSLFLPRTMSPGTLAWFDHGLVGGRVESGSALVRGNLSDWPFRQHEGRFEAHADLSHLALDYARDWPRADNIRAHASFVDNSMLVEADGGQSLGLKLGRMVALIPDFSDSTLDLNAQGEAAGAALLDFVKRSPVGREQSATLDKLKLGGQGTFDLHLLLPFNDTGTLTVAGNAQLQSADLDAPEWNLKLERLTGPLRFDAHGLSGGPLTTVFHGQPAALQLAIAAATGDPNTALSARLDGRYSFSELTEGFPSLNWLKPLAAGRSDFSIGFDITHPGGAATTAQRLTVDSSLAGISLHLPAPLKKSAESALPLRLSLTLPTDGADLQLALGQVARGHFRLASASQPLAAAIAFGNVMPEGLPASGMRIQGHAAMLDVSGWVQHTVAGDSGGGSRLDSIDVNADRALLFEHDFGNMHITAVPQPEALKIDVNSAGLAGQFSVPSTELTKRGITARLQRLYWLQAPSRMSGAGGKSSPSAASPQVGTTDSADALAERSAPANPAATGIAPATLPPFHLWAADLRLGESKLGEARLETWPTALGMHIDQLRTLSKSVQINANGDWNGNANNSHTHLRIDFSAADLGSMLGALGFEGLFDGGKTRAELDARWPGAPSSLALANMDGKLRVDVSHGRIPDVGPGVGRLFGLVSLAELPRRLSLDFGDVFGKGLAFDSITGDFRLANGNAFTDNLQLLGPAAQISITGRTGLRTRDYDQQVLVLPHVGSGLPVVGAVVGGPVGAAAGFAMQKLLGKGLSRAASARYRITGSWARPVLTLIEKHAADVPAPAPSGSAPAPASSAPSG